MLGGVRRGLFDVGDGGDGGGGVINNIGILML